MSLSRLASILAACLCGSTIMVGTSRALAGPSNAAETKAACVAAHVDAQKLHQEGKLTAAIKQLDVCGAEACPALVQRDCLAWRETWTAAIPTIIVVARDRSGKEAADARLFVDGALRATRIDGRAMPLDPGSHEIRVELADGSSATTTVLLREGEARRRVVLGEESPPPAAPPQDTIYEPAAWIPLATVATLGTLVFAGLAGAGKAKESELLDACAPFCTEEEDAEMRRLYLGADIALGVGAAGAVGLALYFAIAAANAPDPRPPTATLVVAPDPGGLVVGARIALPTP